MTVQETHLAWAPLRLMSGDADTSPDLDLVAAPVYARGDWSALLRLAESALMEPKPPVSALRWRALAHAGLGDHESALADAARVLRRARRAGDGESTAWALYVLGSARRARGDLAQAIEALEEARDLAPADSGLRARLRMELAAAYRDDGRCRSALRVYEEALVSVASVDDLSGVGDVLLGAAEMRRSCGDSDGAATLYRRAASIFESVAAHRLEIEALCAYGEVQASEAAAIDAATDPVASERAYADAEQSARRAYIRAQEVEDRPMQARSAALLASIWAVRPDAVPDAIALAERARSIAVEIGAHGELAAALRALGLAYRVRGDLATSERHYMRAIRIAEQARDPRGMAAYASELAYQLRAAGEHERAFHMLDIARGAARS